MKVRPGPAGVHIFDRLNGLNCLADEVRVPVRRWAPAPRQVSIALTNACDLSCGFCYAPKTPASLEAATVCRWLAELDAGEVFGGRLRRGRTHVTPKFADICRYAAIRMQA